VRLLVLSDVHANLEALDAVLASAPSCDAVLCLGDLVGYGPNPNEVVERVRSLPNLTTLVGNHDLAALGHTDANAFNTMARDAALWTGKMLRPETRAFLSALQPAVGGDGYYLAHASPRDPVWEYLETQAQARENFPLFREPVCLVGHTHVPRILEEGRGGHGLVPPVPGGTRVSLCGQERLIINPGAVGQPRDGDPRAAYGVWETDGNGFIFIRVPYALEETQRKILSAGLPAPLAFRLAEGH
jgi:diadenosine tetraphosphatase ApaH/serine/threonine PP2A family protein phosphatase